MINQQHDIKRENDLNLDHNKDLNFMRIVMRRKTQPMLKRQTRINGQKNKKLIVTAILKIANAP